jgi:hypothetical protein
VQQRFRSNHSNRVRGPLAFLLHFATLMFSSASPARQYG